MKRQIRSGVFETNSSTVNTLTIMSLDEYKDYMSKWHDSNWVWDTFAEQWVNVNEIPDKYHDKYRYYENPCEREFTYFEKETTEYTTEHGDKVVAVSIYGYDG